MFLGVIRFQSLDDAPMVDFHGGPFAVLAGLEGNSRIKGCSLAVIPYHNNSRVICLRVIHFLVSHVQKRMRQPDRASCSFRSLSFGGATQGKLNRDARSLARANSG